MLAVAGSAGISDGQAATRCDSPRVSVATGAAPAMNGLKETSGSLDPSRNEFQSHFTQPVKSYNKGYDFPGKVSHHFHQKHKKRFYRKASTETDAKMC